ncbi:MAG: Ig-like domain-containing protein [Oscillatoria sp. PMC 1068.18]|nr:Ig-like domain-containing protein [Oscillatoria sp. PMC 1076.18]MEC4988420.1 Ig-like domain-containing protein [Oscillatoria sp. PMC 1068.18]
MPDRDRSTTFTIEGKADVLVNVTEIEGQLVFDVDLLGRGDLRALFFDLKDTSLIGNLEVSSSQISDPGSEDEDITNLGQDVRLKKRNSKFDVAVAFGKPGQRRGKNKVRETSFTLSTIDGTSLSLDDLAGVDFAARIPSIGGKIKAIAPATPNANDDNLSIDEIGSNYNLLANDTDADSPSLTVVAINNDPTLVNNQFTLTTGGLVQVNSDGTFNFDPNNQYQDLGIGETRTDSFTYRITDELIDPYNQGFDSATATITVTGTNDTPIAQPLNFTINEDDPSFNQSFVASDVDTTDTLSYEILAQPVDAFGNEYGSVINNNNGTFTFDPLSNFQFLNTGESRDVSFQYVAIDDSGTNNDTSTPQTVTITVEGADDSPTLVTETGFFHTTDQSIWDTGSAVVIQPVIPFIGVQWDTSSSTTLIEKQVLIPKVKVLGETIIPEVSTPKVSFSGSSKGKIGLQPRFSLTSGDLDAELPLELSLLVQQQQVPTGQQFTITSGLALADGAFFQTFSPNIDLGLDLVFDLETSAKFNVGSDSYNIFDSFNINTTYELLDFSGSDLSFDVNFGAVGSLSGGLPIIDTQGTKQDTNTLSSFGEDEILSATLDLDGIATTLAGVPPLEGSFSQDIGIGKIKADYNLIDADLIGTLNLNQSFDLDLDDLTGNIFLENGDTYSFNLGQDLVFTVPNDFDVDSDGVLDFTTSVDLDASLLNETNLGFDIDLALEALSANLGLDFSKTINDVGIGDLNVGFGPVFEKNTSIFGTSNLASVYEDDFALNGFNQEKFNVDDGVSDPFSWWSEANLWLEDGTFSTNEWEDYDPSQATFVITHGFTDSVVQLYGGENLFQDLGSAIHDYYSEAVNVVLWDWSDRAGSSKTEYSLVAPNVVDVGYDLAAFLVDIEANPDTTNLIGHSLGAHVMGNAGETYDLITGSSVGAIVGMDPAGPGFEAGESFLDQETYRFNATDAQRTVALHTSNTLGYDDPLADLDLLVNWSDAYQPGESDLSGNHTYAIALLTELYQGAAFAQGSGNPQEDSTTAVGNSLDITDIFNSGVVGTDYVQTQVV